MCSFISCEQCLLWTHVRWNSKTLVDLLALNGNSWIVFHLQGNVLIICLTDTFKQTNKQYTKIDLIYEGEKERKTKRKFGANVIAVDVCIICIGIWTSSILDGGCRVSTVPSSYVKTTQPKITHHKCVCMFASHSCGCQCLAEPFAQLLLLLQLLNVFMYLNILLIRKSISFTPSSFPMLNMHDDILVCVSCAQSQFNFFCRFGFVQFGQLIYKSHKATLQINANAHTQPCTGRQSSRARERKRDIE